MSGKSLKRTLLSDRVPVHEELWFYHEGNRALRQGNWKILHSNKSRPFPWRASQQARENSDRVNWSLYNLSTDRAEQHDLSRAYPERVTNMAARWEQMRAEFLRQATAD